MANRDKIDRAAQQPGDVRLAELDRLRAELDRLRRRRALETRLSKDLLHLMHLELEEQRQKGRNLECALEEALAEQDRLQGVIVGLLREESSRS